MSRVALAITLLLLLAAGCKSIGPGTVVRDRFDYQDALSRSTQEQLLSNLVRLRYGDAPVFLEVASVINSYSIEGELAVAGGREQGFDRSFLGGTARYGDRPTITYNPIQGDAFARSLLRPIPPRLAFTFIQAGYQADYVLRLTARALNGVYNSYHVGTRRREADPEFYPLVNAMHRIQSSSAVAFYIETTENELEPALFFDVRADPGEYRQDLDYTLATLGLQPGAPRYRLRYGARAESATELAVLTRSLFEVFADVASQIGVPEQDIQARRVVATPAETLLSDPRLPPERFGAPIVRIRASREPPSGAAVAVRHRGWWFHIDDDDVRSKRMFGFLLLLYGLSEGLGEGREPVITIPAK